MNSLDRAHSRFSTATTADDGGPCDPRLLRAAVEELACEQGPLTFAEIVLRMCQRAGGTGASSFLAGTGGAAAACGTRVVVTGTVVRSRTSGNDGRVVPGNGGVLAPFDARTLLLFGSQSQSSRSHSQPSADLTRLRLRVALEHRKLYRALLDAALGSEASAGAAGVGVKVRCLRRATGAGVVSGPGAEDNIQAAAADSIGASEAVPSDDAIRVWGAAVGKSLATAKKTGGGPGSLSVREVTTSGGRTTAQLRLAFASDSDSDEAATPSDGSESTSLDFGREMASSAPAWTSWQDRCVCYLPFSNSDGTDDGSRAAAPATATATVFREIHHHEPDQHFLDFDSGLLFDVEDQTRTRLLCGGEVCLPPAFRVACSISGARASASACSACVSVSSTASSAETGGAFADLTKQEGALRRAVRAHVAARAGVRLALQDLLDVDIAGLAVRGRVASSRPSSRGNSKPGSRAASRAASTARAGTASSSSAAAGAGADNSSKSNKII